MKTSSNAQKATASRLGLNPIKKRRKFRDPRLRWMDDLLRSFQGPAPESWLPGPYRYLMGRSKKPKRPTH